MLQATHAIPCAHTHLLGVGFIAGRSLLVERVCCGLRNTLLATIATHCNTLQHTATHCNTLQHTATHCNTSGCCASATRASSLSLLHTATHCNTLQHTAIYMGVAPEQHASRHYRNFTLQHAATRCNTLQHTATHVSVALEQHAPRYTALSLRLSLYFTLTPALVPCLSPSGLSCRLPGVLHRRKTVFVVISTPDCNTLQHAATHCNNPRYCVDTALQHNATHCNTLQHAATLLVTFSTLISRHLSSIPLSCVCVYVCVLALPFSHHTASHCNAHCNTLHHTIAVYTAFSPQVSPTICL